MSSKFVGKLQGKISVGDEVDTVGTTPSLEKAIFGMASPNPFGGMQSRPVKKTITSFSVGELRSPCSE